MTIKKPRLRNFRNDEFFQFFTEYKELVLTYGFESRFFGEFEKFLALYDEMDSMIEAVRKSAYTTEIVEADNARDAVFAGLRNTTKAMLYHFEDDMQKAATKLMIPLNSYGNIARRGFAAETAATYNLVKELREKYAAEIATLGIMNWVDKLDELNGKFSALMNARDVEKSLKPEKTVVEIRKEIENCYANMVRCIEVATIAVQEEDITRFVKELLSKIDRFATILSSREGRKKSANSEQV